MPHDVPFYRDPGIEKGPFKILPRTDGSWIIIDSRRPLFEMTVYRSKSREGCERKLRLLAASP